MVNEAMFADRNKFNSFTKALRDRCEPSCVVILRSGDRMEVKYNHHERVFHTADWRYAWKLDGSSCKNSDLDIVEMPNQG